MMVLISPYSKELRNGKKNPKNYPYWKEFVKALRDRNIEVVQVGISGEEEIPGVSNFIKNASLHELGIMLRQCQLWVSVDNFFQHLALHFHKPGIVIFSQSDPEIFGHEENLNIIKDRKYLKKDQFGIWESALYNEEAFISDKVLLEKFEEFCHNKGIRS